MTPAVFWTQCATAGINVWISRMEKPKRILGASCILVLSCMLMYLANGDTATAVTFSVVCARAVLCMFREKLNYRKIFPILIVAAHLTLGLMFMEYPRQIVSMSIPCFTACYMWFCRKAQGLRLGTAAGNCAWVFYDFFTGLWIAAACDAVTSVSNAVSYVQHRGKAATEETETETVKDGITIEREEK